MLPTKDIKITFFAILAIALVVNGCKSSGQNNRSKDGFVKIFDGQTLSGWKGDTIYWRVENGNLVGEITPTTLLKTNSFLVWQGGEPADFELRAEFRITKSGNSGINYRSVLMDNIPNALKGYQADIDGQNNYTGQNYEERGRTTLAYRGEKATIKTLQGSSTGVGDHVKDNAWTERTVTGETGNPDSIKAMIKADDWNAIHLIVKGNRLQHYINGALASEVTDEDTANSKSAGLLGMQVHVGPPMKVEYRNIQLKQLK